MKKILIFTLTICSTSVFSLNFGHPCTQNPDKLIGGHLHAKKQPVFSEFTVDMTCTNGTILWQHPTGSIRLHFNSMFDNEDFRLCLRDSTNGHSMIFTDETAGRQKQIQIPFLEYGNKTCIPSQNKKVTLLMHSPEIYYMMAFTYSIHSSDYGYNEDPSGVSCVQYSSVAMIIALLLTKTYF